MSQDSLIQELKIEVRRAVLGLRAHPRASRVLNGDASAEELGFYYRTAYVAVREAPALLYESSTSVREQRGSPVLADLLAAKVGDETGHHHWLHDDLSTIGQPLDGPTGPAAQAYVAISRQLIGLSGESFLGTAYVLESLSLECAGTAARNLAAQEAIPGLRTGSPAGLTFFHSHHDADVAHVEELEGVIRSAVHDPRAASYVLLAARMTATLYADFFGASTKNR